MERTPKPVKEQVKDLLAMHLGERRGNIVLILLLSAFGFWAISKQWFPEEGIHDLGPLRAELEAWLAERDAPKEEAAPAVPAEPFPFDPNTASREEWRLLGLSDRQIDGVEHYLEKGGRFRTKSDLGRMYSIRPEQFERLEPFILLPGLPPRKDGSRPGHAERTFADRNGARAGERHASERAVFHKVEVNTADTNALVALPGIGPSFARGIVKYRESLGGYLSLDQLAEVYVLRDKPDAVERLKQLLVADTLLVRRMPINTCTAEELAAHPYARWKIAKPLIAYRTQHGPFGRVEDIKGCALITEEVFRKLAPYLSVE